MKLSGFISGLQILARYYNDPDGYHTGAEHDHFYTYPTDRPLSEEDVTKMRELDWFQPEAEDDAKYDPGLGWSAFT